MALAAIHGPSVVEKGFYEGMTHADRGSWETDGHRVTKNGNPSPVEGVGDWDGKALDFKGTDSDYLTHDAISAADLNAAHSRIMVFQVDGNIPDENDWRYLSHIGGSPEKVDTRWEQRTSGGKIQSRVQDSDGDFVALASTSEIDDGNPHSWIATRDNGPSPFEFRTHLDGVLDGTDSASAVDDLSSFSSSYGIGAEDSGDHPLEQTALGLWAFHKQWIPEEIGAFIHDFLLGNTAPGTLRRLQQLVYGHPETGLKRRLPSYLVDAFGAGGPDFWWSAWQYIFGVDGEGVTQLPNFTGSAFGVERVSSNKPSARGPTTRGYPLDYVEATGGNVGVKLPDKTSAYDEWTVFGVADRDLADSTGIFLYEAQGSTSKMQVRSNSQGDILALANDSDGVGNAEGGLNVDAEQRFAFIASVDFANDEMRIVAEDASGSRDESKGAGGFTGNLQPNSGDHEYLRETSGNGWVGKGLAIGFDPSVQSDADEDALLDALVKVGL